MEQVVVIGSGCAGYTAALYAARANLAPVIIGGPQIGGQLTETTIIDNFPGFPEGIDGNELMENMKKQAVRFGATFKTGLVTNCERLPDGTFEVEAEGEKIKTITVIVATGASARWLGIPSELKYKGSGVHTCATCDGFFYKGKEIIVVGGGDSASEEGNFLTKFADKVWLVHRRDELRASKIMQKRIFDNPKIEIIWDSEIAEIKGDDKFVTSVILKNRKTDEITEKKVDGIFLAIGHVASSFTSVHFLDG